MYVHAKEGWEKVGLIRRRRLGLIGQSQLKSTPEPKLTRGWKTVKNLRIEVPCARRNEGYYNKTNQQITLR